MFLKPATPDLKVPDPVRKDFLPPEGRAVEASPYWTRRIDSKEVIESSEAEIVEIPAVEKGEAEAPVSTGKKSNKS